MPPLACCSDEDALLLVELGVIDSLLNLLDEAILPCKTFAEKTWRTGCGTASTTTLWALCQIGATVNFVTEAGAIEPIIRLCKLTEDEAVLKLTTAAITDMCDKDKHRWPGSRPPGSVCSRMLPELYALSLLSLSSHFFPGCLATPES